MYNYANIFQIINRYRRIKIDIVTGLPYILEGLWTTCWLYLVLMFEVFMNLYYHSEMEKNMEEICGLIFEGWT